MCRYAIALSEISSIKGSLKSAILGDLVLRVHDDFQYLVFEIIEEGGQTLSMCLRFVDVDICYFDIDGSINFVFSGPLSCWREGAEFGSTEDEPAWIPEWTPCSDVFGGEATEVGQLSIRPHIDTCDITSKLSALTCLLIEKREAILYDLDSRNFPALLDINLLKKFCDYGHFRGVLKSFEDSLFTVEYIDGDREDLDINELRDLIRLSIPDIANQRRRRRRRTLASVRGCSRVGEEYNVSQLPIYEGVYEDAVDRSKTYPCTDLWEQVWSPVNSNDKNNTLSKVQRLKGRFNCCDIGEKDVDRNSLSDPEESILKALYNSGGNEEVAAAALTYSGEVPQREGVDFDEETFFKLLDKNNKDFTILQREYFPGRPMKEILQFYYKTKRNRRKSEVDNVLSTGPQRSEVESEIDVGIIYSPVGVSTPAIISNVGTSGKIIA